MNARLPGHATEVVARATAAGKRRSMAEYLHSTIIDLAARGIHDRYLWRLQDLVADRIMAEYPAWEMNFGPAQRGPACHTPDCALPLAPCRKAPSMLSP
jgi:hypothetical protein